MEVILLERVESLGAEVDGVGAVGERGTNGVERTGRGEELGDNATRGHRVKTNSS